MVPQPTHLGGIPCLGVGPTPRAASIIMLPTQRRDAAAFIPLLKAETILLYSPAAAFARLAALCSAEGGALYMYGMRRNSRTQAAYLLPFLTND
jgi:hypothetical protein